MLSFMLGIVFGVSATFVITNYDNVKKTIKEFLDKLWIWCITNDTREKFMSFMFGVLFSVTVFITFKYIEEIKKYLNELFNDDEEDADEENQ